jgi:hypothetical protein
VKDAKAMSDKTGKLYENLTQVIFQAILGQKQFLNLKVERDIILKGKTARGHQIDVYWKFEFGGVPHEAIVQAKDWNRAVELGHLLTFKAVLDDLPGQPRGIYVTRSGYQSGAKDFALAHGILLYELREADYPPSLPITVGGWARFGLVPMPLHGIVTVGDPPANAATSAVAYGFVIDIYTPKWTQISFVISADWFKKEHPEFDLALPDGFKFTSVANHERFFFNDMGENVGNLGTITAEIIEGIKKDYVDQKQVTHVFDPPVFVTTGDAQLPRVPVSSVSMTVEIEHTQCVRRTRMSHISQLVLHQLNSDEKWWFATTPQVIEKLSKTKKAKLKKGG